MSAAIGALPAAVAAYVGRLLANEADDADRAPPGKSGPGPEPCDRARLQSEPLKPDAAADWPPQRLYEYRGRRNLSYAELAEIYRSEAGNDQPGTRPAAHPGG